MDDYDVTLVAMTSHASARPACAPIQGKIVNTVPESDHRYNPKYDSIYNHDYGKASGTQGANCHHELYPYLEGISTNPFEYPNTAKAIANGEIQQHQRALERKVRHDKKMIHYSEKMKDVVGQSHYKDMLSRHHSELRNVVKSHDFLHRDYSRERIMISNHAKKETVKIINQKCKKSVNPQKIKVASSPKKIPKAEIAKGMVQKKKSLMILKREL